MKETIKIYLIDICIIITLVMFTIVIFTGIKTYHEKINLTHKIAYELEKDGVLTSNQAFNVSNEITNNLSLIDVFLLKNGYEKPATKSIKEGLLEVNSVYVVDKVLEQP